MLEKPKTTEFTLQGMPFVYCGEKQAFVCDPKAMIYVLHQHYPVLCAELLERHPELQPTLTLAQEMAIGPSGPHDSPASFELAGSKVVLLDKGWKPGIEAQSKEISLKTECSATEEEDKHTSMPSQDLPTPSSEPAQPQRGIFSRLSRGIKRVIAAITRLL